jgi:hypothetical protein
MTKLANEGKNLNITEIRMTTAGGATTFAPTAICRKHFAPKIMFSTFLLLLIVIFKIQFVRQFKITDFCNKTLIYTYICVY